MESNRRSSRPVVADYLAAHEAHRLPLGERREPQLARGVGHQVADGPSLLTDDDDIADPQVPVVATPVLQVVQKPARRGAAPAGVENELVPHPLQRASAIGHLQVEGDHLAHRVAGLEPPLLSVVAGVVENLDAEAGRGHRTIVGG